MNKPSQESIEPKHNKPASAQWPCTLVTGATSGIGRALVAQLAQAGGQVIALGRDAARLHALWGQYANVDTVVLDLANVQAIPAAMRAIAQQHPQLTCVINNAGIQNNLRVDDAACSSADIEHEVNVNLLAPLLVNHALLPHLMAQSSAQIVNITSALAYAPKATAAVYSATKAGLHLFTQGLRAQLKGSAVQVVEVILPLVDTPMTHGRGTGKISATQVATELLAGLKSDQPEIWVGKTRWLPLLLRLAPGLLSRIMQKN
jgi:uncharacterized oxidoreductase